MPDKKLLFFRSTDYVKQQKTNYCYPLLIMVLVIGKKNKIPTEKTANSLSD